MRNSDFISDDEILAAINDAYCELYDELVGVYENYFVQTFTFPLIANNSEYALPANFYKIVGVDFQVNNDAFITLRPFMEANRNQTLTTNVNIPAGAIRMRYVPAPTQFTSLSDTFDGVAGWERLVSLLVAIDMLDSEESDSSALTRKYSRTLQRVRDMAAPRDTGFPAKVVDVYRPISTQFIYGSLQYRLYQDQIIFVNTEFLGAEMFPPII
jgi:hypothetical protein